MYGEGLVGFGKQTLTTVHLRGKNEFKEYQE